MRLLIIAMATVWMATSLDAAVWEASIQNPGFEQTSPTDPIPGWGWYARQAEVSFQPSTDRPHEGRHCLVFRNRSGMAPEVYGRLYQVVPVLANTRYELIVWVRAKNAADGIHWTDWHTYTLNLPSGTYDWQRVTARFTTAAGQTSLNLGINVTNRCDELAIDSISLRPAGMEFSGRNIEASLIAPGRVTGDKEMAHLGLFIRSALTTGAHVHIRIHSRSGDIWKHTQMLQPGEHRYQWELNTGSTTQRRMQCAWSTRRARTWQAAPYRSRRSVRRCCVMNCRP